MVCGSSVVETYPSMWNAGGPLLLGTCRCVLCVELCRLSVFTNMHLKHLKHHVHVLSEISSDRSSA